MRSSEFGLLLASLSQEELSALISRIHKSKSRKKIELLNLLLQGEYSDDELGKAIYGETGRTAYYQLKSRLLRDVVAAVSKEDSSNIYTQSALRAQHEIQQDILAIDVLYAKGLYDIADKQILQLEKKAKKFQLKWELASVLDLKQKHLGRRRTADFMDRIQSEKMKILNEVVLLSQAQYEFLSLVRGDLKRIKQSSDMESLIMLEHVAREVQSDEAYSLLHRAQAYVQHSASNFVEALIHAREFKKLVNESNILGSKTNRAGASMQLAIILSKLGDLDSAMAEIDIALTLFNKGSSNALNALNVKAAICIVGDNVPAFRQVLNEVQPILKSSNEESRRMWAQRELQCELMDCNIKELLFKYDTNELFRGGKGGVYMDSEFIVLVGLLVVGELDILEFRIRSFWRKYSRALKGKSALHEQVIAVAKEVMAKGKVNTELKSQLHSTIEKLEAGSDYLAKDTLPYFVLRNYLSSEKLVRS